MFDNFLDNDTYEDNLISDNTNFIDSNSDIITPNNLDNNSLSNAIDNLFMNSLSTAKDLGAISDKQQHQGNVSPVDRRDFYHFQTNKIGDLDYRLTGLSNNANIQLLDTNGDMLSGSFNPGKANEYEVHHNLPKGEYYLKVYGYDTDYNLSVELLGDPDKMNSFLTAKDLGTLTDKQTQNGTVSKEDRLDLYHFRTDETGDLEYNVTGLSSNANIQLLDSDGNMLSGSFNSGKADEYNVHEDLSEGDYYLKVYGGGTDYRLDFELYGTGGIEDVQSLNPFIDEAIIGIEEFAQRPQFINDMRDVFGNGWSQLEGLTLINNLIEGKELPEMKIVPDIPDGHTAFANNTIFIERDYLEMVEYSPEDFTNSLTEELGHYIDAQLNDSDSPGDEGYLFSTLTRNEILDPREIEAIKQENDWGTITIDGEEISVELAEFSSIRPEYDLQIEEIVYRSTLNNIVQRNNLGTTWKVFEDIALREVVSSREIPKNTRFFNSPRRAQKTRNNSQQYSSVVPDGVEDLQVISPIGVGGGIFTDGVFVEAKAYNPGGIYLDSPRVPSSTGETEGKWQITGHLDALRRTDAGELGTNAGVPALFLATPAGVRISTDLVRQASRDGVALFHSVLTTPLGNDNGVEFRMSQSALLNPKVYTKGGKNLTPLDFGPGNYTTLNRKP